MSLARFKRPVDFQVTGKCVSSSKIDGARMVDSQTVDSNLACHNLIKYQKVN